MSNNTVALSPLLTVAANEALAIVLKPPDLRQCYSLCSEEQFMSSLKYCIHITENPPQLLTSRCTIKKQESYSMKQAFSGIATAE